MDFLNCNRPVLSGEEDSKYIQAALDSAKANGQKTVVIPRTNPRTGEGLWVIGKAIVIPDGTELVLDNCTVIQATGTFDNMFTAAKGSRNITVRGEGNVTLSGGEPNRLQESTAGKYGLPAITVNAMMYFDGITGLRVENFHIEDQRWAGLCVKHSSDVTVKNLDFDNVPHLPNLYGLLFEHGCHGVKISTLTGRTGSHSIYLRAKENEAVGPDTDIYDFDINDVNIDPARGSIIQFNAAGGHKIHDIRMTTVFDSSDFFEKRRSESVLAIGHPQYRPVVPAKLGDIYNIFLKGAVSRSNSAISISSPLKDSVISEILTFGDIINAVAVKKNGIELENVVFERIYHGQGSKPNNSNSFISLQARGEEALKFRAATGHYEVKHFILPDEEDTP